MREILSALVVHDIKNSLALLEMDLEQLNHHQNVPIEGRKAYKRCIELKNRLVNFLTLYKHDQSGLKPNLREIELSDFLEDLISASQSVMMCERHGHAIDVRVAGSRITIAPDIKLKGVANLDDYLVDMALESALNNAIRYARSSVEIWFEQRADSLLFFVLDDGPGVSVDIVEKRTTSDNTYSTGLGLALCNAVVEAHGSGNVALTNVPGGALFTLEFQHVGYPR